MKTVALCLLLCFLCIVQAEPHVKRASEPHKRMARHSSGKRYVIPSSQRKTHSLLAGKTVDVSLLRRDAIFQRSNITVSLNKAHDGSLERVKRGELHPLIYWTQHYNRALSRRSSMTGFGLRKRDKIAHNLKREAEQRLRTRWASLQENASELQLSKRNRLIPLIKDSNLFGVERGAARNVASKKVSNTTAATSNSTGGSAGSGPGYSETSLKAALGNSDAAPKPTTARDSEGLFIEANDVGYYATLQLGTPPANYKILMDSGSADFWVPSQQCNDDSNCGGHQTIGTKSSSSFTVASPQKQFQVTYGTGMVAGVLVSDKIQLQDGSLALSNFSFGVTTQESQEFAASDVPFDALMGLALSSLSEQKVPTYIEALAEAKQVSQAQMGFHLSSVTETQDSQVTFGGVDTSKFEGSLVEIPNQSKLGFWQGAMSAVTVNGKAIRVSGKTGILDTGTSLIVAPAADAKALHAAIDGAKSDGQGGYILPCTSTAVVAFTFGGTSFSMKAQDMLFVPVNQNDLDGMCQSSVSTGNIDNQGSWLLGDAFLKNVYFATDVTSNKIGLAPSK